MEAISTSEWKKGIIHNAEIDKFLVDGKITLMISPIFQIWI